MRRWAAHRQETYDRLTARQDVRNLKLSPQLSLALSQFLRGLLPAQAMVDALEASIREDGLLPPRFIRLARHGVDQARTPTQREQAITELANRCTVFAASESYRREQEEDPHARAVREELDVPR